MQTVQLSGSAVRGLTNPATPHRTALARSTEVCLGRSERSSKPTVKLEQLVRHLRGIPIPQSIDWYTKAAPSLDRMYLNDRFGCCVFSGKAHNLGVWSYNDADSGGGVQATDKEIQDQYFAYTGGRDSGAIITQVLDYMKSPGFTAGGKRHKIAGYVSCDWTSKELTQIGIALFGAGSIGINLPNAWTENDVWDVTNSSIVGGHDVSPVGYSDGVKVLGTDKDGVVISSWGRLYLITWQAWTSKRWLDELYFMLPERLWTGADKIAPIGASYDVLLADLRMLEQGQLPPLPSNDPPEPPKPPAPAETQFVNIPSLPVKLFGLIPMGSTAPVRVEVSGGPAGALAFDWRVVTTLVGQLAIDIAASKWDVVFTDILAILKALNIFSLQTRAGQLARLQVSWWTLGLHLMQLARAVMMKDVIGVIAALKQIAADLGLDIGV